MKKLATPDVYDAHIKSQGADFQVDLYYEPKAPSDLRRIREVMASLDPREGERILDLGCGVGTHAFHAAKRGAHGYGVDFSPESIRIARELSARYQIFGKVSFSVGDARQVPFGAHFFDKVVSADFFEHITDDEKDAVLREVRRVLKPGGRFVLLTPNKQREDIGASYWRLRHLFLGDKIPVNDLHYGLITRVAMERKLKSAGFTFSFRYADITRPYLACWPLANRVLSLYLLWVATYDECVPA